jgi:hypothetical protein
MYEYMNRAMVALKPMTYAGNDIKPGDTFTATPDDAGYLTRCMKAAPVVPEVNAPEPFFRTVHFEPTPAQLETFNEWAAPRVHSAVGAMQADSAAVDNQGSPDVEPVAEAAPAAEESEVEASREEVADADEEVFDAAVTPVRRRGRPRKSTE